MYRGISLSHIAFHASCILTAGQSSRFALNFSMRSWQNFVPTFLSTFAAPLVYFAMIFPREAVPILLTDQPVGGFIPISSFLSAEPLEDPRK